MKFYNPFKPHIVKRGDQYAIRKWEGAWDYLDIKRDLWWYLKEYVESYATTKDLSIVTERLQVYNEKLIKDKIKWEPL